MVGLGVITQFKTVGLNAINLMRNMRLLPISLRQYY